MTTQAPDLIAAVEMAKRGTNCMTKCPAHDDGTASLHVSPGSDQPVVIRCHAGCEVGTVLDAGGITWAEVCREMVSIWKDSGTWTPVGPASDVYRYDDAEGNMLFQCLRVPQPDGSKTFRQRHFVSGKDKPEWNLNGVERVLYRLPAVLRAVRDGQTIYVAEGEKDAEALVMDGLCGTCNPMGAGIGKWLPRYSEYLREANVVIITDADDAGRQHARAVFDSLVAVDCTVKIVESDRAKDYYEHRGLKGTLADLKVIAEQTKAKETRPAYTLPELLATEFDTGSEIIPGHFAEANVALIVGPEGYGKSLMMRQMAVQCAAGINPFTSADMEPLRVLYIDAENPEHQQKIDWSMLATLARRYRDNVDLSRLTVIAAWEDPPSLIHPAGENWLCDRIRYHEPQLCLMGPISDLADGKLADDDVARRFKRTLYKARAICKTAFICEHHSPHRMSGDKTREMRPFGSSVFRRFPDFGYGIEQREEEGMFSLTPFRGARVRARAWPESMRQGKPHSMEWPWEFGEEVAGSVVVGQFGNR